MAAPSIVGRAGISGACNVAVTTTTTYTATFKQLPTLNCLYVAVYCWRYRLLYTILLCVYAALAVALTINTMCYL
jgi:hypothetical protein